MKTILFNRPSCAGKELIYIKQAVQNRGFSGGGVFTEKCEALLEKKLGAKKVLLTSSCTSALEMAALLIHIQPGDEVIMPSFAFSSTANAFVLRGAKIVFADIRPDTMNMDERLVEQCVTPKTKAVVAMHYGGVSCHLEKICRMAKKHKLFVIEDAAQALMGRYKGKMLGTIGDMGCFSFHESKNIHCGEGGALVLNNGKFIRRAEIIREKGTNRASFFRGEVDKYTWVDAGSSYLTSELNAAFLYAQLEKAEEITRDRLKSWNLYYKSFKPLQKSGHIDLPSVPEECRHNAHLFYIKVKNAGGRDALINFLKEKGINTVFHYVPLHTSPAGQTFGRFHGADAFTSRESERLLRLPMYYGLSARDIKAVVRAVQKFYSEDV